MIQVEHIRKSFGGIQAVDDCSFDIPQGRITGLIGPNGAGKTTLFGIIAGFMKPNSGRILLDGADVTGWPPHRLCRRGLVRTFQIPHVFDRMSVRENLMVVPAGQHGENLFAAWLSGARVAREDAAVGAQAEDVMGVLNLTALADERAGNLSGGQKKLVELGRTMMSGATTILLDEPGAGVNRTLLATLTDDIARLNRDHGYTFCIIEHDMDVVAQLCDPVIVMAEGRVIAEGSFDAVRRDAGVIEAYLGGAPVRQLNGGSQSEAAR